jgi:beta-phosphoglucomutase-like phosphatase (HAD superfamily)
MIAALHPKMDASVFDLIVNSSQVKTPKPAPDAYYLALQKLGQMPEDCVAIENNLDGLKAARAAGIPCVAFPDENTAHHKFEGANLLVSHLDFNQLKSFSNRDEV